MPYYPPRQTVIDESGSPLVSSVNMKQGNVVVTASDVGLDQVDNTHDMDKPVSNPQQDAVDTMVSLIGTKQNEIVWTTASDYLRGDGSFATLDGAAVGLDQVNNTPDSDKPVSVPVQEALDSKQDALDPGSPGTFLASDGTWQSVTPELVGLPNVDDTSDLAKPISTATQAAINAKEPSIVAGSSSQFWRGDKTWQAVSASTLGLGNVDNTHDLDKPISTATQSALSGLEPAISTGTTGQFWAYDKIFRAVTKANVGLANVDNTADVDKPISTATQTALNAKVSTGSTLNLTGDQSVTGNKTFSRILVGGTAPTIVAGAGSGSGATASVVGRDQAGIITVTTGTGVSVASTIATLTFSAAFANAPAVVISPVNSAAASLFATILATGLLARNLYASATTTTLTLASIGTLALGASTSYQWAYQVSAW